MSSRPWYERGLRFECSTCGNCCSGPSGTVFFDEEEGRRMAEALGVTEAAFYERYAVRLEGRWTLTERRIAEKTFDCVFLDRESQPGSALCRVYRARPTQCSTWPFWSQNLSSAKTWYWVKRNTPCPGMDKGSHHDLERIESVRAEADASDV